MTSIPTGSVGTASHILIVEDDDRVRRVLSQYLIREGYQVSDVSSAAAMRVALRSRTPDLVLLDLMLPDASGFELAKELHETLNAPIIILTGKTDTVDKIVGLELGADDYITKPFDQRELLARVRVALRRSAKRVGDVGEPEGSALRFSGWRLDLVTHDLTSPSGSAVALTSVQFRLLATLAKNANRVVSRADLLKQLSGRDWYPMDRSMDVQVWRLRQKIEEDPKDPKLIRTVRGVGYEFTDHVQFE